MEKAIDARERNTHKTWQEEVSQIKKASSGQDDNSTPTSWQQLDAKICQHPFLQNFTKEQRNNMQKGVLPANIDEALYKQMRKQFIDFLVDLFRIKSMILKNIYKDSTDYETEVGEPYHANGFFKKALEDDKDYKLLPKREKLRAQFDGVAYTTAFSNCIGRYDADYINSKTGRPASFLGLFLAEYKNCLNETRTEYTAGLIGISKADRNNISKIIRYLETQYPSYTNKVLPNFIYQELSDIFDLPLKKTKDLVAAIRISHPISLDAPVGESDLSIGAQISDDSNDIQFSHATTSDDLPDRLDVYEIIQTISSLELKGYNRLLMDNELLYPIHPETYSQMIESETWNSGKDTNYKDALKKYHERLKKGVWDFSYLNFVGWKNEEGNIGNAEEIHVLCDYYPVQPLQKQTIAKYRNVSPANVSYHAKRFDTLRRHVKHLLEDNERDE